MVSLKRKGSKNMISFYIVRHGQTLLNCLDRAQGWSDSPLTDSGKQAAIDLGNKLKEIDFNAVYTSDMLRAVQTAELILRTSENNVSVQKDIRLREWCLGNMEAENNAVFIKSVSDWLGGADSFVELNSRLPDVANAIYEHDTTGMAEPFSFIVNRLQSAFIDIVKKADKHQHYRVLVVTHAFMIKTIFYLYAPEQLCGMDKVKNADISKLIYDENGFHFL